MAKKNIKADENVVSVEFILGADDAELDALGHEDLVDEALALQDFHAKLREARRKLAAALDRTRPAPDMTGNAIAPAGFDASVQ